MSRCSSHGFTLVEVMAVTSIIGVMASIAVPSFINWRRYEVIKQYKNEISGVIVAIPDEAKRWGATCNISLGMYNVATKPFSVQCRADGSQISRAKCNSTTGCNISDISKRVPSYPSSSSGESLVYLASNVKDIYFTPRGQLSGGVDVVFVVAGSQYLGGSLQPQCLVISRLTSEFREGVYSGFIQAPRSGATPVYANIKESSCR